MKHWAWIISFCILMMICAVVGRAEEFSNPNRFFRKRRGREWNHTLMGAGFGLYPEARVFFGSIPMDNMFPGATDGRGAIVFALPGEGIMIFGQSIQSPYAAMIRCSVRMDHADASIAIATIDQGPDVFVSTNTPHANTLFVDQYRRLSTFYVPPSTGFQPLIQVVNTSETEPLTVYIDNFDVYLIDPNQYYSGEFLNGDTNDPDLIGFTPDFLANAHSNITGQSYNVPDNANAIRSRYAHRDGASSNHGNSY